MLSALAAGAGSIDADIFRLDDYFNAFVDLRGNVNAGERSMPPLGLIERRDAYQAMNANLTLQKSEGVFAIHSEGRRLQTRFLAGLVVVKHGLETLTLGPSQVHAQQH